MRIQPIGSIIRAVMPTNFNTYSIYKGQERFINARIRSIFRDDSLSDKEKREKIAEFRNQLGVTGGKPANKPLEAFVKQGGKLAKNLEKPYLNPSQSALNKMASLINFGLVSGQTQADMIQNLSSMRTMLALNYEKNSGKITRIDGMLDDSSKAAATASNITNKASGAYAEIAEKLRQKEAEKAAEAANKKKSEDKIKNAADKTEKPGKNGLLYNEKTNKAEDSKQTTPAEKTVYEDPKKTNFMEDIAAKPDFEEKFTNNFDQAMMTGRPFFS